MEKSKQNETFYCHSWFKCCTEKNLVWQPIFFFCLFYSSICQLYNCQKLWFCNGREAQHKLEKWTQSDLTGFKKRGSIWLEIGKKGSIGLNINTMRGQSDRAWLFEGFEDAEKGTQSDWKFQKRGSSPQNLPTMPKYGSTPPGDTMHCLHHTFTLSCVRKQQCTFAPREVTYYISNTVVTQLAIILKRMHGWASILLLWHIQLINIIYIPTRLKSAVIGQPNYSSMTYIIHPQYYHPNIPWYKLCHRYNIRLIPHANLITQCGRTATRSFASLYVFICFFVCIPFLLCEYSFDSL